MLAQTEIESDFVRIDVPYDAPTRAILGILAAGLAVVAFIGALVASALNDTFRVLGIDAYLVAAVLGALGILLAFLQGQGSRYLAHRVRGATRFVVSRRGRERPVQHLDPHEVEKVRLVKRPYRLQSEYVPEEFSWLITIVGPSQQVVDFPYYFVEKEAHSVAEEVAHRLSVPLEIEE